MEKITFMYSTHNITIIQDRYRTIMWKKMLLEREKKTKKRIMTSLGESEINDNVIIFLLIM